MAGYEPGEWAETDTADVFAFEGQSRPQTGKSTGSYVAQVTAQPRGLSLWLPVHRCPRAQKLTRHADPIAAWILWLSNKHSLALSHKNLQRMVRHVYFGLQRWHGAIQFRKDIRW